jgi:hypothetical protein
MKKLEVLAAIHYGNYEEGGKIIDDKCPCCKWDPAATPEGKVWFGQSKGPGGKGEAGQVDEPEWRLGEFWAPGCERGCGAYFQIFNCQNCGLVYATHLN